MVVFPWYLGNLGHISWYLTEQRSLATAIKDSKLSKEVAVLLAGDPWQEKQRSLFACRNIWVDLWEVNQYYFVKFYNIVSKHCWVWEFWDHNHANCNVRPTCDQFQAILLDCRNFDKDAKKGTDRDVAALKHLKSTAAVAKEDGPWYKELMEARKDAWKAMSSTGQTSRLTFFSCFSKAGKVGYSVFSYVLTDWFHVLPCSDASKLHFGQWMLMINLRLAFIVDFQPALHPIQRYLELPRSKDVSHLSVRDLMLLDTKVSLLSSFLSGFDKPHPITYLLLWWCNPIFDSASTCWCIFYFFLKSNTCWINKSISMSVSNSEVNKQTWSKMSINNMIIIRTKAPNKIPKESQPAVTTASRWWLCAACGWPSAACSAPFRRWCPRPAARRRSWASLWAWRKIEVGRWSAELGWSTMGCQRHYVLKFV